MILCGIAWDCIVGGGGGSPHLGVLILSGRRFNWNVRTVGSCFCLLITTLPVTTISIPCISSSTSSATSSPFSLATCEIRVWAGMSVRLATTAFWSAPCLWLLSEYSGLSLPGLAPTNHWITDSPKFQLRQVAPEVARLVKCHWEPSSRTVGRVGVSPKFAL